MTDKPTYEECREHRACSRKHGSFETQLAANTAVLRIWQKGRFARAYQCDWCRLWHITTQPEGTTTE